MSDRPAEIWCDTGLYWDYKEDWSEGSWQDEDKYGGEKYVRADLIEELEAKLGEYNLLWQTYELDKVVAVLKGQNDD